MRVLTSLDSIRITLDIGSSPEAYFREGTGKGGSGAPHHFYIRSCGTLCCGQPLPHYDYKTRLKDGGVVSIVVCGEPLGVVQSTLVTLLAFVRAMFPESSPTIMSIGSDFNWEEHLYGNSGQIPTVPIM